MAGKFQDREYFMRRRIVSWKTPCCFGIGCLKATEQISFASANILSKHFDIGVSKMKEVLESKLRIKKVSGR
jgi:hypothetical protein